MHLLLVIAASCTAARGASSPAPPSRQSVARPEPEERSVDSRASDALSIVESLAESLHLPEEEDDVLDDEEYPDIYWTMLKRNVRGFTDAIGVISVKNAMDGLVKTCFVCPTVFDMSCVTINILSMCWSCVAMAICPGL